VSRRAWCGTHLSEECSVRRGVGGGEGAKARGIKRWWRREGVWEETA
jgi:hypothetical protein